MAKLPAAQQYIGKGLDLPESGVLPVLSQVCCNPACDAPAFDMHHIVRRSYLNGPFPCVELFGRVWLNIAQVCRSCHRDLEENRAHITANLEGSGGFYSWAGLKLDPYPNPVLEDGESDPSVFTPSHAGEAAAGSPSSSTGDGSHSSETGVPARPAGSPSVTPGSTCPTCDRRVPHPRKPSSPRSKVIGFRVPLDESDDIMESWKVRAERLGVLRLPHWQKHYLDITNSLIDGLSDDVVRAIGKDYLGDL